MLRKFVKCFRSSCVNKCDEPLSDKLVEYSCIEQWSASPYHIQPLALLPADDVVPDVVPVDWPEEPAPADLMRQVPFVPSMPFALNSPFASRPPSTRISYYAVRRTRETSVPRKSTENRASDSSTIATRDSNRILSHPGGRGMRQSDPSSPRSATSAQIAAAAAGESAKRLSDEQSAKRRDIANVVFRRRRGIRKNLRPCTPFHLSKEYEAWFKKHIGKCTKRHAKDFKILEAIQLDQNYDLHTISEEDEREADEDERVYAFINELFTSEDGVNEI